MIQFKLHDTVRWTSQAGSYNKEKTGRIVEVVPAGISPETRLKDPGGPRNHVSYVVQVGTVNYWPRVAGLHRIGLDRYVLPGVKVERRLTTCPTCHGSGMVSSVRVSGAR